MSDESPVYSAVPIGEVSRLTGVNIVTLRAWERRYGLLKPMRTPKGHRLYSSADINKVKEVQSWLARGLAIGKVKDILIADIKQPLGIAEDNPWPDYANQLDAALAQLNRNPIERLLKELSSVYPMEVIADRLLAPLVEQLQWRRQFGSVAKLAFLHNLIRQQLHMSSYKENGRATKGRLLVVKLAADDNDILPFVLNYSLLANAHRSEYLGYVPRPELIFAAEQMCTEGIVLYGDNTNLASALQETLEEWRNAFSVPLFLTGKIVAVCVAHASSELQHFLCAEMQQDLVKAVGEVFAK